MSAPDLNTDEGRAAYRKELRLVAWPLRWGGLALIVLAAAFVYLVRTDRIAADEQMITVAYGALAVGWALVLAAIWKRTQHHKRRLREGL